MPRRNFAEVLIGAVVLLVAAGFLAYAIAHSGRSTAAGYLLYARFDHIDGLSVGNDVRIAGVKVGTIDSATLDPKTFQAVVGVTVGDDVKLPKDSSAVITSESLLGGKYLALTPGGDDATLQPGQTITITQGSINIEELLGKFIFSASNLASSAKGGQAGAQSSAATAGGATGAGAAGGGATGGGAADGGATGGPSGGGATGAGTTGGGLAPLGVPAGGKSP